MKYLKLVDIRKSIREYRDRAVPQKQLDEIQSYFGNVKKLVPEIDIELFIATGNAGVRLEGVAGYQGNCFFAPAYLILLSEKKDYYIENAGYITEDLILKLTDMGLENCWITVDESSDMVKKTLNISSDKDVVSIVAFGYGKTERTQKRLDIQNQANVHVKRREGHIAPKIDPHDMTYFETWGRPAEWNKDRMDPYLEEALIAASYAPSFLNRQPYRYIIGFRRTYLCYEKDAMTTITDTKLDLGATMLNYAAILDEVSSVKGAWKLGTPEDVPDLKIPEGYGIAAYYNM